MGYVGSAWSRRLARVAMVNPSGPECPTFWGKMPHICHQSALDFGAKYPTFSTKVPSNLGQNAHILKVTFKNFLGVAPKTAQREGIHPLPHPPPRLKPLCGLDVALMRAEVPHNSPWPTVPIWKFLYQPLYGISKCNRLREILRKWFHSTLLRCNLKWNYTVRYCTVMYYCTYYPFP